MPDDFNEQVANFRERLENVPRHTIPRKGEEVWEIHSWPEFRQALADMKPRSKLYETVKAEMVHRRHWKQKPRGRLFRKGHDPRRGTGLNPDSTRS